ncbi:MAG: hypothetical protein A3G41_08065 [Elusimicrobia bacterium RIFCSPLOWO2_12_FULL_59_9]|nr:MAG: hypothetical protein A3G41_08065 [Elusimicrobia bacterium RIFCSPLOWO2_12_FULL_59_9]
MSQTHVSEKISVKLWVKAGGRCEYDGCNQPLWHDDLTMAEMNRAYIAHIVADSSDGPRGDAVLSPKLAADLSNLMLLCDTHHRLIDREQLAQHPAERLQTMKAAHESRVETLTAIQPNKKSDVLLYGANIGAHDSPIGYQKAVAAMIPERYPASPGGIILGMTNNAFRDRDAEFWRIEAENLRRLFDERVKPRLADRNIQHLSVFAVAPQPLLMLLGALLSDISPAEVYQLHREPQGWEWRDHPDGFDYEIEEPAAVTGPPALVLSLSATISNDRVTAVITGGATIWRLTVREPHNDFLKSRRQLQQFCETVRPLMNRIKARHGEGATLHVFPVVPVATAVEFGRILMPKADLPIRIYDQNRNLGGFVHALDLNAIARNGGNGDGRV